MSDFNTSIIEDFRANGGVVERFGGAPMVILNTIGAKSGEIREIPLVMLVDGDRHFIFASAAGGPQHPAWHYNLIAHPEVEVELGTEKFTARLVPVDDPERGERLDQQIGVMDNFAAYKADAAPRLIPVYEIVPA
jgi:deazaflavin-dependent oxidoreductase (nitroreductase family)